MNFEDLKKFFFRKPKNALEGSDEAAPAGARQPAQNGAAIPEKLAEKCEKCGQIILSDELRDNFGICPKCGHYKKLDARARIALCAENFTELFAEVEGGNPLDFPGYDEKLASLRSKTGEKDAVVCGTAFIGGVEVALFSMDHRFQMGSMGHAVGEKITAVFEYATERRLPVVGFVLSGGARMQEGIVSLMQMAKTSAAVAKHGEAGLLYIAVLTDPTTGGVSASFAFEADIILAEQGAPARGIFADEGLRRPHRRPQGDALAARVAAAAARGARIRANFRGGTSSRIRAGSRGGTSSRIRAGSRGGTSARGQGRGRS